MFRESGLERQVTEFGSGRKAGGAAVLRFIRTYAIILFLILCGFVLLGMKKATANELQQPSYSIDGMLMVSAVEPVRSGLAGAHYPALFNTKEEVSYDLSAFTKFSDVMARFRKQVYDRQTPRLSDWFERLAPLADASFEVKLRQVNNMVNLISFRNDSAIWGQDDFWATPEEVLTKGAGDCEDLALMKFTSLKALGINERDMRLAIVHDQIKNVPHAVLVVYHQGQGYMLDNQIDEVTNIASVERYRPYYSISRLAWWRHTPVEGTDVSLLN